MKPSAAVMRAHAAKAINQVIDGGRTIDWVKEAHPYWCSEPLENELIYGTLRHVFSLTHHIEPLLEKPLRKKDSDIHALMLVGAYQLKYLRVPSHAAIKETVEAVSSLRKPWAKGLLNAILRRVDTTEYAPDQSFDHPAWLVKALERDYPRTCRELLAANNERAPMALRVNTAKITVQDYAAKLAAAAIAYTAGPTSAGLILREPMASAQLPGWAKGEVAVQDAGAQFAAELLHGADAAAQVTYPPRVLDACAAPGGKLAHLIERFSADAAAHVVAIDASEQRVARTRDLLARLGHTANLVIGDATHLDWWDGTQFTHILLDAPCSGTGTIRRHPDIKSLLQPSAIAAHSTMQGQMLNNLWRTLAPGGNLLYCTCSLLVAENDDVIGRFTKHQDKNVNVQNISLPNGAATRYGWQLSPTDPSTDGFYYALLRKSDAAVTPDP